MFGFRLTIERAFEKMGPMKRTRVRWGRVAVLGLVVAMPFGARAVAAEGKRPAETRTYVVRAGDTLWSIAAHMAGPGADPRPMVDELEQANRGATVFPGETIRLP